MSRWFALLLPIVAIVGSAALLLGAVLRGEAGRRRLLPVLRPLMKNVFNPPMLRAAAQGKARYAVVHHVGRRSGTGYHTPVDARRTSEGVLILLPYGPVTDWCRNVLAAGRCALSLDGEELELTEPEVVAASVAEAQVPADVARSWHAQGIEHYLWLKESRLAGVAAAAGVKETPAPARR